MKQNMTLRRIVVLIGVVAVILPLMFFTVLFQLRTWRNLNAYIHERMQMDLENRNMLIDLTLDKYEAILDDFCMDEDLYDLLRKTQDEDCLMVDRGLQEARLRQKMITLCGHYQWIEGLTVVAKNGELLFYDESMNRFAESLWEDNVFREEQKDRYYLSAPAALRREEEQENLIHIVSRISDRRDEEQMLGTVILSLNQKVLWQYQDRELDSDIVVCQGNTIVAAEDGSGIGNDISEISQGSRMILTLTNDKTGWTIWNFYSTKEFRQTVLVDSVSWFFQLLIIVVLLGCIAWCMMAPIVESINEVEHAMSQVEQGNFLIRVGKRRNLPKEMVRIIDGFNTMAERAGELLKQVRVTMEGQKNAELSAMEAQIDPHFLYNTLDTINWKAIEKGDYEISAMVGALADILRYTIRNPGDTVSISQELYWLEQYVMFQKEKLDGELEVSVEVPQEIRECRVHKLLLQPFLENSIKHGFYQKEGPFQLKLRMNWAEGQIHIMIEDNGRGIPQDVLDILNRKDGELAGHVGIANVKKRLALYYGDNADLYFESKEGSYTAVHLFIQALGRKGEET